MNTADRSIALVDIALRRRFGFVEMNPDFDVLTKEHIEKNRERFEPGLYELLKKSVDAIRRINLRLCNDKTIGRDRQIGHSFLFKSFTLSDLVMVWQYELLPLLEEYCYSDYAKLNRLLFGQDSDTDWIGQAEGIRNINDLDAMLGRIA
jgi:5-methylcytosine-specific restriction enzyme B